MNWFQVLLENLIYGVAGGAEQARQERETENPQHANRVHLFHGTFKSELEATDYCLNSTSKKRSDSLVHALHSATIDTSQVEIIFSAERIKAAAAMLSPYPEALLAKIGTDNTVIMIAEAAFGEHNYSLNDTPILRYIGAYDVS